MSGLHRLDQRHKACAECERTLLEALARLVPLWPEDLLDRSESGRLALLAKIERALVSEIMRQRAGSHSYDLARHVQLARLYRELAQLHKGPDV